MRRVFWVNAIQAAGGLAVMAGVWQWSPPAAIILGGVGLILLSEGNKPDDDG